MIVRVDYKIQSETSREFVNLCFLFFGNVNHIQFSCASWIIYFVCETDGSQLTHEKFSI